MRLYKTTKFWKKGKHSIEEIILAFFFVLYNMKNIKKQFIRVQ